MPKREYCNDLCTKPTKGTCKVCDALDEADRFIWRWLGGWLWRGFWADLTGPLGYRVCAMVIGAYVGLFAVIEARHERQMNRALYEHSTFITMASSGNRGTFIAAMKEFGPVQTMSVFSEPFLLKPWTWPKKGTPNVLPLRIWVTASLPSCTADECGYSEKDKSYRVDLRLADLQRAELQGVGPQRVDFSKSDLTGADLREANLQNANLKEANLHQANLDYTNLRGSELEKAQLSNAYLRDSDLQGANLTEAQLANSHLPRANLYIASLGKADLQNAILWHADLRKAQLQGANLSNASLQGADLQEADIKDAVFQNANLWGTDSARWTVRVYDSEARRWWYKHLLFEAPQGTNLANVRNWTAEQFSSAYWNEKTIWPEGYTPPCPSNLPYAPCKEAHSTPPDPFSFIDEPTRPQ